MTQPIVFQGDRRTVTRSSIRTFATVIFGAAVAFGTTLFVSNTVGDGGAGVFFQILAFFAIASTACAFGSETALVKFLTAQLTLGYRADVFRTIAVALIPVFIISSVLAGALWFLAPVLATFFHDAQAQQLIQLLAIFIIPGSLSTAMFGGLRGFGRVGVYTTLQNVFLPSLRFASVAAVILLGLGTVALAAAWVIPVALVLVISAGYMFHIYRSYQSSVSGSLQSRTAGTTAHPTKSFWSFAAGRGAGSLVEIVLEWIDVILVGVFLGPAAAGVYGVVNRCLRLGQMADHSARIVMGPMLGAAIALSDQARARAIYLMSTRVLLLVAWPFYLLLLIGGPTILAFFGPDFVAGYPAMVIISIAMALTVLVGGVQSVLLMSGRSRWQVNNKLAALAVALIGNLTLIPILGLPGAAISWAAAVLVDSGLAAWEVHHFLHLGLPLRSVALSATLALSVYGAGLGLARLIFSPTGFNLAIELTVLTAVYAALVWRFRVRLGLG